MSAGYNDIWKCDLSDINTLYFFVFHVFCLLYWKKSADTQCCSAMSPQDWVQNSPLLAKMQKNSFVSNKKTPLTKGRVRNRGQRDYFLLWFDLFVHFPFFIFIVDVFAHVPIAPPPPRRPLLPSPSGHHRTVVCVCGLNIYAYVLWLILYPFYLSFHFLYIGLIWEWNRKKDGIQRIRNHWAKTPDVVQGTTEEVLFQRLRGIPD